MAETNQQTFYTKLTTLWAVLAFVGCFIASLLVERFIWPEHGKVTFLGLVLVAAATRTASKSLSHKNVVPLLLAFAGLQIAFAVIFPWRDEQYAGALLIPLGLLEYTAFFYSLRAAVRGEVADY
jgi:hypothetical protein